MARATEQNTTKATKSRRPPSTVQKLCDAFRSAVATHEAALRRQDDAETAAARAMPAPPKSIRPSKANLADVPSNTGYTGQQRAIRSYLIQSELKNAQKQQLHFGESRRHSDDPLGR